MQKLVILIGLPASGKSTYAKAIVRTDQKFVRISRDDFRLMLNNIPYGLGHDTESLITSLEHTAIDKALKRGFNVIVDNQNLNASYRKKYHKIAKDYAPIEVHELVFDITLSGALAQNSKRSTPVPEEYIKSQAKKYHLKKDGTFDNIKDNTVVYEAPIKVSIEQDITLPGAIICDLDGTLALLGDRDPYDASKCVEDEVNCQVLQVIESVTESYGHKIIFVTARDDTYLEQTKEFIRTSCSADVYWELHMRTTGDKRKDSIVKKEIFIEKILPNYYTIFVLEDRNHVVEMYRNELGLTCFQVADGGF